MIEPDRIISHQISSADKKNDLNVRPKQLVDYIGQETVKEQLAIFMSAAKMRRDALDHCLIFGPPGLGKTTLANIIANEMGAKINTTSGPIIEKTGDLASMLTNLKPNGILFIDEIHRLNPIIEEFLYPALEDFKLDIIIGEGPAAQSVKLDLPPFTLIGATTRAGMLTSPLRDRFGILQRLEFYNNKDLTRIVMRSAKLLNIDITESGAMEIGQRSRGTPRIANKLLRRARDYSQVKARGVIDKKCAESALQMLKVDRRGFDILDHNFLSAIVNKFDGGPVGVDSIATALSEDRSTIEDIIEPYLIQQGFILRTPRGRIATSQCFQLFNKAPKDRALKVAEQSLPFADK